MSIDGFHGEDRFLSNFWPVSIEYGGRTYASVEHAYQAAKFPEEYKNLFLDPSLTAGKAKRLAWNMAQEGLVIRSWTGPAKLAVMKELLQLKFQHEDLRESLLATGNAELIEGNTWGDTFWGVCQGEGKNHLGKLLMEIRYTLRNKERNQRFFQ